MTTRDCGHEHITFVQGMPRCASCAVWIPTGLCRKCARAIDDHPQALACDVGKKP